jgi:hypothetical protein
MWAGDVVSDAYMLSSMIATVPMYVEWVFSQVIRGTMIESMHCTPVRSHNTTLIVYVHDSIQPKIHQLGVTYWRHINGISGNILHIWLPSSTSAQQNINTRLTQHVIARQNSHYYNDWTACAGLWQSSYADVIFVTELTRLRCHRHEINLWHCNDYRSGSHSSIWC